MFMRAPPWGATTTAALRKSASFCKKEGSERKDSDRSNKLVKRRIDIDDVLVVLFPSPSSP